MHRQPKKLTWRDWLVIVLVALAYPALGVLLWAAFDTMFGK